MRGLSVGCVAANLVTGSAFVTHQAPAVWQPPQCSDTRNSGHVLKGHGQRTLVRRRPRAVMALGADLSSLWQDYLGAIEAAPLLTKSVTAGVIFPGADLAAQFLESRTKQQETGEGSKIDLARVLRFAVFGFFVQAPWNHFFYMKLDELLPPTEALSPTTAIKLLVDQGGQAPIFTVLIFATLTTLEGKGLDQIKQKLDQEYWSTLQANWKLWIPASFVNLAFCPPELRVLFTNVVFFFWSIFLSLVINKPNPDGDKAEG